MHELQRLHADQHLARLCGLFEPRGHVHRVPGGEPLLCSGHDLTGRDADAYLHAELGHGLSHLERGAHRAQCIVFVQLRDPEDGHDGVADELLDRSAVPLDDRLHAFEVARQQPAQRLWIE